MADHTEQQQPEQKPEITPQLSTMLAMIGGGGIILAIVALGVGVVNPNANSSTIGMLVLAGIGLLVLGVGGWVVAAQPHKNFDDINQPMYHGHHDDHDHEADESEDHSHTHHS